MLRHCCGGFGLVFSSVCPSSNAQGPHIFVDAKRPAVDPPYSQTRIRARRFDYESSYVRTNHEYVLSVAATDKPLSHLSLPFALQPTGPCGLLSRLLLALRALHSPTYAFTVWILEVLRVLV